jgi:hypothetical protein
VVECVYTKWVKGQRKLISVFVASICSFSRKFPRGKMLE